MKILYLDTSSSFLYCGLFIDDTSVFEIIEKLENKMSEDVIYLIEMEFKKNKISTDSVDKIILVNGPGSFTGVRIGITIAKTYAWAKKIPIITISSLYAMALSSKTNKDFIVPIIDARRGFVYSAIYDKEYKLIFSERYIDFNELKSVLNSLKKDYTFISNDKFDFDVNNYVPDMLKIVSICKNNISVNPHLATANYLKKTEAEEKKNALSN